MLWLSLLEEESQLRTPLCGILVTSRYIIFYVFGEILFLSHVFRSFLIVFSERGLVAKGKTNLKLFHQLFWVIFCAFLVVFTFIMPISHIIRGKFPETTRKGQICLLAHTNQDIEINQKGVLIEIAYGVLVIIQLFRSNRKSKQFVRGLCPNKNNHCIRIYRRNILNMHETMMFHLSCYMISFVDNISVLIFNKFEVDPQTVFWTCNALLLIPSFIQHLFFGNRFLSSYYELKYSRQGYKKVDFFITNQVILATSSAFVCLPSGSGKSQHLGNCHSPNSPTIGLQCFSQHKPRAHSPPPPSHRPGLYTYAGLKQFTSSTDSPKYNSLAPCSPKMGVYSYIGLGQCNYTAYSSATSHTAPSFGKGPTRKILTREFQKKAKHTLPDA